MTLGRLDIRLDHRPAVEVAAEGPFLKEVPPVRQIGIFWCWAACIESVGRRVARELSQRRIAHAYADCPRAECDAATPGPACDVACERAQLQQVWRDNQFHAARYESGAPARESVRAHLLERGPLQVELGTRHVVLVDSWRRGVYGTVQLRLMDPATGEYALVTEEGLRRGWDHWGPWTATVTHLP